MIVKAIALRRRGVRLDAATLKNQPRLIAHLIVRKAWKYEQPGLTAELKSVEQYGGTRTGLLPPIFSAVVTVKPDGVHVIGSQIDPQGTENPAFTQELWCEPHSAEPLTKTPMPSADSLVALKNYEAASR
ncbi:MAG: hypothetical protein JWL63_3190 [Rhodocyclales bacterium]|nr:hypothetical protein [Rhodocyclales bacterium]